MKIILFFFVLFGYSTLQAQAYQSTYKYQKNNHTAAVIHLPYKSSVTEDAIKKLMQERGAKSARTKGMFVFRNIRLLGKKPADLYFDVNRKSRQEKDFSTVYLIAARLNENLATRNAKDLYAIDSATAFLNKLSLYVTGYALELAIESQQEVIDKAGKKYAGLMDDSVTLQKRLTDINNRIETNSKYQEQQREEIEKQKQALEVLVSKKSVENKIF